MRKNPKFYRYGIFICILLAASACNQNGSFNAASVSPSFNGGGSNNNPNNGGGDQSGQDLSRVDLDGTVDSGEFEQTKCVELDKKNGLIRFLMPLNLNLDLELKSNNISKLPGVTIGTFIDANGSAFLEIAVPIKYILKRGTFYPDGKLPNGDSLPKMPGDSAPFYEISSHSSNRKAYIYMTAEAFGIFVESHSVLANFSWSWAIKTDSQPRRIIGWLSSVPPKMEYSGGYFLSFRMPADLAAILGKYFSE